MTERILVLLTPELLAAIDAKRGDEPRTAWIRRVVAKAVGKPSLGKGNPVGRPKNR